MKKPKAPHLVTIAIITTATIIFWIFFEVYRIFTSTPSVQVPEELLTPITPTLDTEALENIKGRVFFEEEEIPETLIATPSPRPTTLKAEPTPTEELEQPRGTPTPVPTATESAGT